MINHGRTLLLNRDGSTRPDSLYYLEEYVDPAFRAVQLPAYLQEFYEILIGSGSDNAFANYRLRQYMLLLHSTEFQAYVYALDPRITYLTDRTVAADQDDVVCKPINALADSITFYFTGKPAINPSAIKMYSSWLVEAVTPTLVRVTDQKGNTSDTLVTFSGGSTNQIAVPGQPDFWFKIASPSLSAGAEWLIETFTSPPGDLTDLMDSLTSYINRNGYQLFPNVEPFTTFSQLWNKYDVFAYRMSGLLLAYIYQIKNGAFNTVPVPIPPAPPIGNTMKFRIVMPADESLTLPIDDGSSGSAGYVQKFTVNWGDGSPTSTVTSYNDPNATHSYLAGTYSITMTGTCEWFSFNHTSDCDKPVAILAFSGDMGFKHLDFAGCSNLLTIVPLGTKIALTDLTYFIAGTGLTSIPAHMFDGCPNAITFNNAMSNLTALVTLPDNLFRYNTKVTDFSYCFAGCTNLKTIGDNMFNGCTATTDFSFCFTDCHKLTAINNTIFVGCSSAASFSYCFCNNFALGAIPTNLFKYCVSVADFSYCFSDCTSLAGSNWGDASHVGSVMYWAALQAIPPVNTDSCFSGCTSLTGYPGSIPIAWGGTA